LIDESKRQTAAVTRVREENIGFGLVVLGLLSGLVVGWLVWFCVGQVGKLGVRGELAGWLYGDVWKRRLCEICEEKYPLNGI
jgi:hypothetical protein